METTKEAFLEWLSHPVTKEYHKFLAGWVESLKGQWAARRFDEDDNLIALGQVDLLQDLQNLTYEQLEGSKDDDDDE